MHTFAQETEDYCLGDVGISKEMQEIMEDACVCLPMKEFLARAEPLEDEEKAAVRLFGALHPQLKRRPSPRPPGT